MAKGSVVERYNIGVYVKTLFTAANQQAQRSYKLNLTGNFINGFGFLSDAAGNQTLFSFACNGLNTASPTLGYTAINNNVIDSIQASTGILTIKAKNAWSTITLFFNTNGQYTITKE